MAHAPECNGPVYSCPNCGEKGLTIEETFEHEHRCPTTYEYTTETWPDGTRARLKWVAPRQDGDDPFGVEILDDDGNPFEIICAASGDRAEAETAEAALVAASTLARDAADTGAQGSLRAARRTLYVTEHGTYNGVLTEFARRGVRDLPKETS